MAPVPSSKPQDDEDEWQAMPVELSASPESSDSDSDVASRTWPRRRGKKSSKIGRERLPTSSYSSYSAYPATSSSSHDHPQSHLAYGHSRAQSSSARASGKHNQATNATGRHLDIDDARGYDWRSKPAGEGSGSDSDSDGGKGKGYTQLRLDEDEEAEEIHAATEYLFQDGSGPHDPNADGPSATPLSQMATTKQLLTEGQKIAYVGLCSLAATDMVKMLKRVPGKEMQNAINSAESWRVKVMARLYQHMDIEGSEQSMIESLAMHGVLASDLAPSLITTHTVSNPDFDPEALREREEEEREAKEEREAEEERKRVEREEAEREVAKREEAKTSAEAETMTKARNEVGEEEIGEKTPTLDKAELTEVGAPDVEKTKKAPEESGSADIAEAPESDMDSDDDGDLGFTKRESPSKKRISAGFEKLSGQPSAISDDVDGDIGSGLSDGPRDPESEAPPPAYTEYETSFKEDKDQGSGTGVKAHTAEGPSTPKIKAVDAEESTPVLADPNTASQIENHVVPPALQDSPKASREQTLEQGPGSTTTTLGLTKQPQAVEPPPGALDGVTTSISSADETITLDIRWTVLCDLFLVLTADSVYDARSRVLLETVASFLGLTWMDVTKFEKRVTDALEIEEGVESLKDNGALKRRMELAKKRRMIMMGLATVGGGLVIGLSAGLLAPVIGAGVGAALGAVGISGTSGFLGGVGGAAIITTTGTVGGMSLGGRGMSRRTRSVKTFEFKSIHNNKRVNAIVAMPGFMNGPQDDVRLPFGVIDSVMGDCFSVLWEPDMMQEMGDALGILWNETLVQGVQQVLAATVAGAMFSALAWPLWLTKLGYLIDNPWSNALDRSKAAGLILADVLSRRQLGVRPITLVGYSLGARAIFYALVELARTKTFGVVQNVYIMGAPVTATDAVWKEARSVVAGRFVSAFSKTDWILGYLHRAASGGLRSIAGLHPVERVQEIENIDVTHVVPGHLQYRALMPLVLGELGFKTTADYFDEPEDLTKVPERQVVREDSSDSNYELKTVKTSTGGFGKIWKRKGTSSSTSTDQSPSGTTPGTPQNEKSTMNQKPASNSKKDSEYEYDYDEGDEDLPPRIEDPSPADPTTAPEKRLPEALDLSGGAVTPEVAKTPTTAVHFDTDAMLAELRESGIEVKELESSLPPLAVSTRDVINTSSKADTEPGLPPKLELPSGVFSADKAPSPSLAASAREEPYRAPEPSPREDLGTDRPSENNPGSKAPTTTLSYARSFSTASFGSGAGDAASDSFNNNRSINSDATASGASIPTLKQSTVSLSFASYDDEDISIDDSQHPISSPATAADPSDKRLEEKYSSYGLSSEQAKDLERKFMSSSLGVGADVGASIGIDDAPWGSDSITAFKQASNSIHGTMASQIHEEESRKSGSGSVSRSTSLGSNSNSGSNLDSLGFSPVGNGLGGVQMGPDSGTFGESLSAPPRTLSFGGLEPDMTGSSSASFGVSSSNGLNDTIHSGAGMSGNGNQSGNEWAGDNPWGSVY
ncbi:DUF726-domain-containing protein [Violaceomyces palustris]|uniref:DUF726-domain-containing protein n=1 Tax=Violaceomyces palustris TaxID=1673888 RepID=A0ACD0P396_9BASI|nr:DUF726-domain-containing protein [Violaceomyces palustris]